MKQLLFFFSICLFTVACSNTPEKEDSGKSKPETEVAANKGKEKIIDTVPKRNPVVRDLNATQIKKLNWQVFKQIPLSPVSITKERKYLRISKKQFPPNSLMAMPVWKR